MLPRRDKVDKTTGGISRTALEPYRVLDLAVGLQERYLHLVQNMVQSSIREWRGYSERNWSTTGEFLEHIEGQGNDFKTLVEKSAVSYMLLLYAPFFRNERPKTAKRTTSR